MVFEETCMPRRGMAIEDRVPLMGATMWRVFIKRFGLKFVIIFVYIDDLNIIGTLGELENDTSVFERKIRNERYW